jgi:hypothetical protein
VLNHQFSRTAHPAIPAGRRKLKLGSALISDPNIHLDRSL